MDIDVYHCPNCDVVRGPSLSECLCLSPPPPPTSLLYPHALYSANTVRQFSASNLHVQPALLTIQPPRGSPPSDCRTGPGGEGSFSADCIFLFFQTGGRVHQRAQRADINRLIEWCCKPSTLIGQAPRTTSQPLQLHLGLSPHRGSSGLSEGFAQKWP